MQKLKSSNFEEKKIEFFMMFVEYKQKFLKLQEAITKKLINYTLSELKTYAYQNTIKKMNGQPKTGRK